MLFRSLYLEKFTQQKIIEEKSTIRHRKIRDKRQEKGPVCNAMQMREAKQKRHRADALALRAEERRDKLRKAAGRGKYLTIRRYLNGETHMREPHVSMRQSITHGREPGELKHLSSRRKRKKHRFRK